MAKFNWLDRIMDVKQAVQVAKEALQGVFENANPATFRLEEVVLDDYNDWVITLSYEVHVHLPEGSNGFEVLAAALRKRIYKVVTIGKGNGEVKAIKMYKDE